MMWILAAASAAGGLLVAGPDVVARPILHDAVALNIGVTCQWQSRCMALQHVAMKRSLSYVTRQNPPSWRVHLCNHNAARGGYRVDWVGYDHCIRNIELKPPVRTKKKRRG